MRETLLERIGRHGGRVRESERDRRPAGSPRAKEGHDERKAGRGEDRHPFLFERGAPRQESPGHRVRGAVEHVVRRAPAPVDDRDPPAEHAHVLDDAGVTQVLADAENAARVGPIAAERGIRLLSVEDAAAARVPALRGRGPAPPPDGRALILYTSGTTGKPKGAVHTHGSLAAQVASLSEAWDWSADDAIPNVLPLHHTHGLVNVTLCALANGARVEMLPGFDAEVCWRRLEEGGLTVFMAVPTVYAKLAAAWSAANGATRARRSAA